MISMRLRIRASAWLAMLCLASLSAQAKVVAIDLDLPIDQVPPDQRGIKIGDHHRARVFYETASVDPKSKRVVPLHMQHFVGGQWIPVRLDPVEMPMGDSWLDLSRKPYTYHYHSAVTSMGEAIIVDFDAPTRRMTIRRQSDRMVVVSAPYIVDSKPVADARSYTLTAAPPRFVMHDVSITLDQVDASQEKMFKAGSADKARVFYDASLVDPATKRVPLVNMQHFINGRYLPEHADPVFMPVNDAWLDMKSEPYRFHFFAKVTHGVPIIIQADEKTQRLSIHPQSDPKAVLISGPYRVDPTPHSGPDVDAAATRAATTERAPTAPPASGG